MWTGREFLCPETWKCWNPMCLLPVVNEASVVNVQYWNSFALFICLGGELQEWRNSMFFFLKKSPRFVPAGRPQWFPVLLLNVFEGCSVLTSHHFQKPAATLPRMLFVRFKFGSRTHTHTHRSLSLLASTQSRLIPAPLLALVFIFSLIIHVKRSRSR